MNDIGKNKKGLIIIEIPHTGPIKYWASLSEEEFVQTMKYIADRTGKAEHLNDFETAKEYLANDLQNLKIIQYDDYRAMPWPDTNIDHQAQLLGWI